MSGCHHQPGLGQPRRLRERHALCPCPHRRYSDGVTPAELQQRIGADRRSEPYLLFRDLAREQHIMPLRGEPQQLTIGRASGCDVCLHWDAGVSRAHARLERLGESDSMLVDDGLSRNGSIVNGERLGSAGASRTATCCALARRSSSTARRSATRGSR
jgi:hypothetical protein